MSRLVLAPGVSVLDEGSTVYLAPLPDGPIAVLEDIAASIFRLAVEGSTETLADRVRAGFDPPGADVADEVERFIAGLIALGLLVRMP